MTIDPLTIIGLMAGTCTTISFFPQMRKIYLTRRTRDLSLPSYLILSLGLFLWIIYGVLAKAIAIILPNTIIFIMSLYIVAMKIRYK